LNPGSKSVRAPADSRLILGSPVARALALIGDRWAHLIIRDAFLGVRRFEDFRRRTGAARGTLASRLKRLEAQGILDRSPYQESPVRYEYRLTGMGLDLYPQVLAARNWELRWNDDDSLPSAMKHSLCGKRMHPRFRCQACEAPIRIYDVSFRPGTAVSRTKRVPARFQRRSKTKSESDSDADRQFLHFLDVVGDRWTGLVVASLFFGLRRYDEISDAIGIATNILSDRLKALVSAGVLKRVPYQHRPVRHEYRLTEKGADLYIHALQVHEWAERWLLDEGDRPLTLEHKLCNSPLRSEVVCSECKKPLKPREVTYERANAAATDR
jgi:DNA-binding HxlR family transcriptional regulator